MGRRGKRESKHVDRGKFRGMEKCSDDSDEDYMVDQDEELEESEEDNVSSFAEDETEDSLSEFEEEEEDVEEEEFMEKKVKKVGRPREGVESRKRNRKSNGIVMLGKKFSSRRKSEDDCDDSDEYDGGRRNGIKKPAKNRTFPSMRQKSCKCDDSHEYHHGQTNGALNTRMKKRVSYIEEANGICDDTDDNDDVFTPDEFDDCVDDEDDDDYVDDEDEVIDFKRNKQLGRPRKQGEKISRGQKRRRYCSHLKNNKRKRLRNKQSLTKKTGRGVDVEFVDHEVPVEQKKTKVTERRLRRRNVLNSDSHFEPEDEYTILEEEREQVREANNFCRDVTATLRSSTPVEKLKRGTESVHRQMKYLGKKGKEKEDGSKIETGKRMCGICLSEEGKRTVQGALNCCSHYFCFACIMEWSKVESRCPVCKQRFATISKSAKSDSGFDLRTSTIQVPERDQVYQPSEEELRGYLDPYEHVTCTECQQGGDDALMLLCDICDSPAHTYCIGLGYNVPEGNWYCDGCRPTAFESLNPLGLNHAPNDRVDTSLTVGSSPMANVRETFDLNEAYVPDTPLSNRNEQPSPRVAIGDFPASSPASGSGALTVFERRRIQHQIRHIFNMRRQQDSESNGMIPTVSGSGFLGSQVVAGGVLEPQLMELTQRSMTSLPLHGRFDGNTRAAWQNTDPFIARLTSLQGTAIQKQVSTSNEGSYRSFLHNEFGGINASFASTSSHHQVQLCSSRPNLESDVSASPQPCREVTSATLVNCS